MSNRPLLSEGLSKFEGESDDNELTYEIHPEGVKSQLKRLPTQSSPGPNGVPYYVWKSSSSIAHGASKCHLYYLLHQLRYFVLISVSIQTVGGTAASAVATFTATILWVQHLRRSHGVVSFVHRCWKCKNRRNWTDERRQAFLEVADRVGWSNHSVITAELDMSIRQIRNYEEESGDTSSEADNRLPWGAEMPEEEPTSDLQPVPAAGSPSESSTLAAGGVELTGHAEPSPTAARQQDHQFSAQTGEAVPETAELTDGADIVC